MSRRIAKESTAEQLKVAKAWTKQQLEASDDQVMKIYRPLKKEVDLGEAVYKLTRND